MVSAQRVRQNKRSMAGFIGKNDGRPADPINNVAPTISGTAKVGQTLTAANGTWTGKPTPTLSRQWKAAGLAIPGATGATYVPVTGDIGKAITVTITGTSSAGVKSATSAATAAVIA
jgi:hypothetical protein